ncbi:uncharacterized protein LOC123258726 isoform X2 [Cotesia glomerata]|uniref:Uncharacterized protein n=1 Tax=Cotesia glomerata TaxID=32391 RepID=A0AAV7J3Q5_COTGL|nr:uncharacterized protein LOC123258726 isoform X2 [Cotesia glomerata]XP_044574862.1 uncharacterized protein LOC123258726 isoform X2 [Cotesia glomerata]XP_044574871.1 uncharacterized protein LOC123258726 isoform X2 [Cotesia glomerata]KAH0567430.1 hypothetical protein KQX54_009908 [Cotesia glomerata]
MGKLWTLLLIFCSSSWAIKDNFSAVDKLRYDLLLLQNLPIQSRSGRDDKNDVYFKVFEIYDKFSEKITNEHLNTGKRHLNSLNSLRLWALVQKDMNIIEGMYSNYLQKLHTVTQTFEPINIEYWNNFADVVFTHPNVSISAALERISDVIIQQNLFIDAYKEAIAQICDEQQSPQQLLYNLYNIIAMTEIRGFMMMQFSYTILRVHKNGTFHDERLKTLDDYKIRVSETLRAVRTAMAFAPRDLWRCDPDKHVEDVTYTELKQLFQGYIVNEVDLNPSSSCRENCAYYSYSNVQGCFGDMFCAKQRKCNGKVLNCQYFDSDMWICPSDINSNRRYEYVEYENGRVFGKKGSCKKPITKVDSWWRWIFWHCSYCMCYCDDHNSSSDRYFNLRDVTSDVANNKVITGFKFIKVNQIIHVQIQEGRLTERGRIEENSASWKPVDNYTIRDRGVNNGEDYHTLSWEKRAIDLDDLTAPDEHILTGVRFRMVGSHLNFEVRITPFNYSSGLLIRPFEKSQWTGNFNTEVSNGNSEQKRRELVISNPDVPIRIRQPSSPDSLSNQFLNFGPTDLDKDAAQSTIPFLDTQPVITNPPFPLAGAGIYHKGRSGSGGYIALKAITYDFKDHLRADVPSIPAILELNQIPAQ